jgi:Cu/Ag efflux pump CusA
MIGSERGANAQDLHHLRRPLGFHFRPEHLKRLRVGAMHYARTRLSGRRIVMLSVPFALVGGVWLMAWMQFNMSVAVAVGFIALAGVAAETGVVMLIYLDHALTERRALCAGEGKFTREDLRAAIMAGAMERVRPKMMTVNAIIAGLLPILWSMAPAPS